MELVGHRGCAAQYPENTIHAMEETAKRLDWIELDVRRCASGELVVFHDERVDELTDGSGAVRDLTLAELEELRVEGSDERIPTLERFVTAVPSGLHLQVELKELGIAAETLETLAPVRDRVRITSFRPAALAEVAAVAPGVERGLLFNDEPEANLELAAQLGCRAVNPPSELCANTDVVARAKERWFSVVAWKGLTEEAVQQTRDAGADATTTDSWEW